MTEIVCKCGTSRLEDVQCAECGEYFKAGWIPVSERLPEAGVEVLLFDDHSDYLTDRLLRVENGEPVWMCDDDYVTHWMPLPNPPEAE